METLAEVISVPIIVAVVYVIMAVYKHVVADRGEIWTRLIPLWAAILGAALGIYMYLKLLSLMLAEDVVSALLVGLVSGLSAVGFNQIGKQLSKTTETDEETTEETAAATESNATANSVTVTVTPSVVKTEEADAASTAE